MQQIPAPPPPPALPGVPGVAGASPADVLTGLKAERRELGNQLDRLENRQRDLSRQIRETPISETAIRKGLEARLADVDARVVEMDKQISVADLQVARATGIPGAVQPDRPQQRNGPPEEVIIVPAALLTIFVLFPLTIAYARRLWRRGAVAVQAIPTELMDRMGRLETAVDSVALEVERIGEGQRFVSKLLAEGGARHLGAGAAEPVELEEREPVPVGASRGGGRQ